MPPPIVAEELALLEQVLAALDRGAEWAQPTEESARKELEHLRSRFFRTLDGHGHRDAPHDAQRNALFSLSKNPSSGS